MIPLIGITICCYVITKCMDFLSTEGKSGLVKTSAVFTILISLYSAAVLFDTGFNIIEKLTAGSDCEKLRQLEEQNRETSELVEKMKRLNYKGY